MFPRQKSVDVDEGNMLRNGSREYDRVAAFLTNSLLSLTTCLQTFDSHGLPHGKSFPGAVAKAPDPASPASLLPGLGPEPWLRY